MKILLCKTRCPPLILCASVALLFLVAATAGAQIKPSRTSAHKTRVDATAGAKLKPDAQTAKAPPHERKVIFLGGASGEGYSATLQMLERKLRGEDPKSTTVVFTGNYTTPGLFDSERRTRRARAERQIFSHVKATTDFVKRGGKVFFLPGHQDIQRGGHKAERRLRKTLNRAFQKGADDADKIDVMPNAGCGDIEVLELGPHLRLLLVNSEWWFRDSARDENATQGCDIKNHVRFDSEFADLIKKNRQRRVVIASHHPLLSLGAFGGNFSATEHLKPIPVLGSIRILGMRSGLVSHNSNHPVARAYTNSLGGTLRKFGTHTIVSGFDKNLQLTGFREQVQVIAGTSGVRADALAKAEAPEFSAELPGWVEYKTRHLEAEITIHSGVDGEPLFRKTLPPLPKIANPENSLPPPVPKGIVATTYGGRNLGQTGKFVNAVFGAHYRAAYHLMLPFEILDLETEQGGLFPLKIGGGGQTNSIRFEDLAGGQWVARSVAKSAKRFLPYPINRFSMATFLLEDGFTASHPAAAVAVAPMAHALGLMHTTPRLMYLPDQARLGDMRGYVDDQVVLVERRPEEADGEQKLKLPQTLGGGDIGAYKYISMADAIQKVEEKPWRHYFDQEMMLKARLFDILIGDWDRHEDQWRIAVVKEDDGRKRYLPIPRDRDQAFANYDGVGLALARIASPDVRPLRPFNKHIRIKWLTLNAKDIDPTLLNQVTKARWMSIAKGIQTTLSDEHIDDALAMWPRAVFEENGEAIKKTLIKRRSRLLKAAKDFFEHVNDNVDAVASESQDRIVLNYREDKSIELTMSRRGEAVAPYFKKIILPADTRELNIFALAKDDTLEVIGKPHRKIRINFLGGSGDDVVCAPLADAKGSVSARSIRVYDDKKGMHIDSSIKVKKRLSDNGYRNHYDRHDIHHRPSAGVVMPVLSINPDNGAYLGLSYDLTRYGFKKNPFAERHHLSAALATATLGAEFEYNGRFTKSVGPFDQDLNLLLRTPAFTRNFFGYTNQTIDPSDRRNFYRVRQALYEARYGLGLDFGRGLGRLSLAGFAAIIDTEATPERFVSLSPDVQAQSLGPQFYAGGRLRMLVDSTDNAVNPKRGLGLLAEIELRDDLTRSNGTSANFILSGLAHIPFGAAERVVLSSIASVSGIIGDYAFYFAPTLGADALRAYAAEQYAGQLVFSQTTDLRIDAIRIRSGLPGTVGLTIGVDHGRVFGPNIVSNAYHVDVGGGIWWTPLNVVGLSLNYYVGLDLSQRFTFNFGSLFPSLGF